MVVKKLHRDKRNKFLGGVCSGLANYLDMDPLLIRLIWAIFTVFTMFWSGILVYLIAWAVIPEK